MSVQYSHQLNERELVLQAERKVATFDRLPDLDNANVGSHFTGFFTGGIQGMSPVFLFTTE